MSACSCEPGVQIPMPHPPWECRQNPGWDERLDPDCTCGFQTLEPGCVVHGWLVAVADGQEWVA